MGVLYEEILVRLVKSRKLSIAAACGCVRHLYWGGLLSPAATGLHTAAFLCRGFMSCSDRSPKFASGIDEEHQRHMYADSGVSLVDMVPEVSLCMTSIKQLVSASSVCNGEKLY